MVYDLIVVGNGLAAQTFLYELFSHLNADVKKSQNFSIAQIFSEEVAPSCSLRTTATVSLNGTEEGISELGDELRSSFFKFEQFFKQHQPDGVEEVSQLVTSTNDLDKARLIRRYKVLGPLTSPLLKTEVSGVILDSYVLSPLVYTQWFSQKMSTNTIIQKKNFVKKIEERADGLIHCELMDSEVLTARKIVLCTGAYAKVFSQFYPATQSIGCTSVVAGSYFEKTIDLNIPSFYLTIDGHNCIYRSSEKKLIIGSASSDGAVSVSDFNELKTIVENFRKLVTFDLGPLQDFKAVSGLRHKGIRRRPVVSALNAEKSIYMISGFYKNGFTFSLHFAEKMAKKIAREMFNR